MKRENFIFLCKLILITVSLAGTFILIGIDYAADYQKDARTKAERGMWK